MCMSNETHNQFKAGTDLQKKKKERKNDSMAKLFCDLFVAFIFHYQRVQNCAYACLLDIIECDDPVVLNALIDQVSNFTVQWVVLPCVWACWRRFAVQWGASSGLHLILFSCSSSCSSIIICPPQKHIPPLHLHSSMLSKFLSDS